MKVLHRGILIAWHKSKSAFKWLFSRFGRYFSAIAISCFLILSDYIIGNYPYPILDNVDSMAMTELISARAAKEYTNDSVMFINVAFDKVLVPVSDDFGDTIGHIPVTDRELLTRILTIAKDTDYKFLVLDVRFEAGLSTPNDSLLWHAMNQLPRFVYSIHADITDGADSTVQRSGRLADYGATLTTGFTRWQFLQPAGVSTPLAMYQAIDSGNISKHGLFYTDHNRLCRNAMFIPLHSDMLSSRHDNGEIRYPLLNAQILKWNTPEEIQQQMSGRIVIIGDFENDMHDTYIGSVPGPTLILCAYNELHYGRHIVDWRYVLILFLVYFAIYMSITSGFSLWDKVRWIRNSRVAKAIISFIGWEFVLSAMSLIMYLLFTENFNTFIPSIVFTCIGWIENNILKTTT